MYEKQIKSMFRCFDSMTDKMHLILLHAGLDWFRVEFPKNSDFTW